MERKQVPSVLAILKKLNTEQMWKVMRKTTMVNNKRKMSQKMMMKLMEKIRNL